MKYWDIIADMLSAPVGRRVYCSAVTSHGWRWVVDAYCGDGRRYIVESDELLSAFLELGATLLLVAIAPIAVDELTLQCQVIPMQQ
jgi:hypothetical protein